MSSYPPGTRVEVRHNHRLLRGTVVALSPRDRARLAVAWPLTDYSHAVAVAVDEAERVELVGRRTGGWDLVVADPDSDQIRPLGTGLRVVT